MSVAVHGLDALEGETAFAFFVVRLREPVERDELVRLLRYIAPLIPDPDTFIDELPADLDQSVRLLAMPWSPPEAGHATQGQRRLIESAGPLGVEAAWFFQTGTSLPSEDDEEADEEDEDDDEVSEDTGASTAGRARTRPGRSSRAMTMDDGWVGESSWNNQITWSTGELTGDTKTMPIELVDLSSDHDADFDDDDNELAERDEDEDDEDEDDEDDEDEDRDEDEDDEDEDDEDEEDDEDGEDERGVGWSHGPPPQVTKVRFPIDGYPAILEAVDGGDFGIAFKLAGEMVAGEGTVLFGFHTLWLAPYGGRYRNTAVTIDRAHHAAHLWVDRFAAPCSASEQVHHVLWVLSRLDEVVPIVHARFAGATTAQKYAGLMGDTTEPFVLGGNPLLAVYAAGGQPAVDRWIAEQTVWSREEVAQMLRELAIDIVTARGEADRDGPGRGRTEARIDEDDEADDDDEYDDDDDDDDEYDDDDDGEAEGNEDEDRGRQITSFAGELLAARAAAGKLDSRAAERLLPVLATSERFEHRRRAVVQILGALRYRPAVPALIGILEQTSIRSALDSAGKEDFIAATAAALGAIGDPAAIPALSRVVAAPGAHNDEPRPVAADALAACLAAAPEPRDVDDAVLAELLTTIRERNDGELNAETQLAYGRIVHQLPPERRADARRRLVEADSARDDALALLARQAALVLASPTSPIDAPPRDLGPLLHESLTSVDYDHDYTVRNLRVALRVAEIVPELVAADDLVWLTRFSEPDIRARAHALLVALRTPLREAPVYDPATVRELDDDVLVREIGEAHVVGRAALIAEAGRRGLARARRAIIDACHDVISRARQGGESLLDPDTRVLEAAVPILRAGPLDPDVIALFDRMLRHPSYHVKWELLQNPPEDERLIGGMFHVLGERWGWQEKTAQRWLEAFQGTPAYDAERKRAPRGNDRGDDGERGRAVDDADDEDMN